MTRDVTCHARDPSECRTCAHHGIQSRGDTSMAARAHLLEYVMILICAEIETKQIIQHKQNLKKILFEFLMARLQHRRTKWVESNIKWSFVIDGLGLLFLWIPVNRRERYLLNICPHMSKRISRNFLAPSDSANTNFPIYFCIFFIRTRCTPLLCSNTTRLVRLFFFIACIGSGLWLNAIKTARLLDE